MSKIIPFPVEKAASTSRCFWCGGTPGEDFYGPCPGCADRMAMGVAAIRYSFEPGFPEQPAFRDSRLTTRKPIYPTGQWRIMDENAMNRNSRPGDDVYSKGDMLFFEDDLFDALFILPRPISTTGT